MDNIPNIISTKDFSYLSDMFSWNYTAIKEFHHMLEHSNDEVLNEILNKVYESHVRICKKIIEILKMREGNNGE